MRILEEILKEELISHLVLPQIEFGANQNDWNLWTMVPHLQIKIPVTIARRTHKSLGKVKPTSGYHLALTFSKLAGFTSEKQIRKTSWKRRIREIV